MVTGIVKFFAFATPQKLRGSPRAAETQAERSL
jgi:hypothetical protein